MAFADAYGDLQSALNGIRAGIELDLKDLEADAAEMEVESRDEFFANDGQSFSSRRSGNEANATVVTFRIGGVPYLLNDVPLTAWFAPYVRDVAEKGIVSGYRNAEGVPLGMFGPERSVSIEELAKMAVVAAGIDPATCGEPKNLGAQKSWSAQVIACAERNNFAVYGDGTVGVTRPATRAEVVMTLLQAFGVQLQDLDPARPLFIDVSASTLFSAAINTAVRDGIVIGYTDAKGKLTGLFGPEKPVNRAEIAKMLSIAIQLYARR